MLIREPPACAADLMCGGPNVCIRETHPCAENSTWERTDFRICEPHMFVEETTDNTPEVVTWHDVVATPERMQPEVVQLWDKLVFERVDGDDGVVEPQITSAIAHSRARALHPARAADSFPADKLRTPGEVSERLWRDRPSAEGKLFQPMSRPHQWCRLDRVKAIALLSQNHKSAQKNEVHHLRSGGRQVCLAFLLCSLSGFVQMIA